MPASFSELAALPNRSEIIRLTQLAMVDGELKDASKQLRQLTKEGLLTALQQRQITADWAKGSSSVLVDQNGR